jgi:Na+/H+ antiporter NhaB
MMNNLYKMFLGNSPDWYKNTIIAFLIINPMTLFILNYIGLNGSFYSWVDDLIRIYSHACISTEMLPSPTRWS